MHNDTLTREQAEACLPIVQTYIDRTEGPGWTVALYPPGHEGAHWVASLECGADNWPYAMSDDETVTWPAGVWVEPATHFALALIPTAIYVHDSVPESTPEFAVFGADTCGIVDESHGGVIAYVHADHADALRDAWAARVTPPS